MNTDRDRISDAGLSESRRPSFVTLVHGTWAKDAAWLKEDSKLCQGLSRIEPPPIIRSFHWSGRNSHDARLQAARALTKQLGETSAEHPLAEHHLIGHSHGGNVALYALRDSAVCDRIASVVCLATPFIHAQARPIEPVFLVLRVLICSLVLAPGIILMILSLLFALLAVLAVPESPLATFLSNTGLAFLLVLAGLGLSGFLVWGGTRVARRLYRWLLALLGPWIERYQGKLVKDYNHRAPRPVPVLNAQVERDEPALWLRALRWASEPQGDSRMVIVIAALFALTLGAGFVWQFINDASTTESLFSIVFYATFMVVSMIVVWLIMLVLGFVFSHLIFIAMPLLIRAHSGGFGEWSLIANWLVLIEARIEPAGSYLLDSFRITAQGKGLRHSQVYEDDRVIERIGQWLTNKTLSSWPDNSDS